MRASKMKPFNNMGKAILKVYASTVSEYKVTWVKLVDEYPLGGEALIMIYVFQNEQKH